MARNIAVGIDIGTYQVKTVIAEGVRDNGIFAAHILGTGIAESRGMRHGCIINQSDIVQSIASSIAQASKTADMRVRSAYISIGGLGLGGIISQGSTIITRADSEISALDVEKAIEICESEIPQNLSVNKKIIHNIPLQYKIDGKAVLGQPVGMKGMKLEVRCLFITCIERHLSDIIDAVEQAGIEVLDVMASPLAAGLVTLSKTQKIAGCVLANIGAETVSIVVYENNIPISLEVFPIGSTDITNDIALGLKISLEEAESIKLGGQTTVQFPRRKLEEIVEARLSDMFELIEAHLKKIGRNGLLPAGIVITGGGSGIGSLTELAKETLKLPSRLGTLYSPQELKGIKDSTWSVAYGLCIFGFSSDSDRPISQNFSRFIKKSLGWFKQFLP
ncbi:MAG: cell division protein FtsA [Candidatus Paceibacterota bacterium]|jgi:cell division protein FtsA